MATTEIHEPRVIDELNRNKEAYEKVREEMEATNWGRTVLLHDGAVISVYNDEGDAYAIGCEKYGAGNFSIHLVGQQPIDLGIHNMHMAGGA